MRDHAGELADLVRQADPDRYLSTLYAPQDRRPALLALHAFNAELASIRDRARQPLPGEMRLQWWRDTIAAGAEATAGHPVAEALLAAIDAHGLPRHAFEGMLEARVFDLYDDPMPSRGDLEGYCGETASALIQLGAMVLAPAEARAAADLCGHAGCAQAMTGLLRLLPLHRARGQCYLPAEMLAAAGTTREALLAGTDPDGTLRATAAMEALAREHLEAFLKGAAEMPPALRPAFLPLALTGAYLDRFAADRAAALAQGVDLSPISRHWLLLRHAMRGWPRR